MFEENEARCMVFEAAVEVRYAPTDEGEAARRWRRGGHAIEEEAVEKA